MSPYAKVLADYVIMPQWYEYCPDKYFSAEYIDSNKLQQSEKTGYFLKKYIFPGIDYVEINNYWVERRNEFNTQLNLCLKIPDDEGRNLCYMEVKKVQKRENELRAEIEDLKDDLTRERNENRHY